VVTAKKWRVSARPCLKEAINRSSRLSAGGVQRVLHYPHEQPRTTRREHTAPFVAWDDKSIVNSPENVEEGCSPRRIYFAVKIQWRERYSLAFDEPSGRLTSIAFIVVSEDSALDRF
jgi:hypothetical protein